MCCRLIRDAIRRMDVENHSVKVGEWFNLNGDYIFLQNNGFGEVFDEIRGELTDRKIRRRYIWEIDPDRKLKKLFIATMMWGFGNNLSGPFGGAKKLDSMLHTENFEEKLRNLLDDMRNEVEIKSIFEEFIQREGSYHIENCGTSYGTKFLYFVGKSLANAGINLSYFPLILDRNVAYILHLLSPEKFPEAPQEYNGEQYKNYLEEMKEYAWEMECEPDQIELFFFNLRRRRHENMAG